jgi:uncharacterized paraquat-inducible protein A
MKAKKLHKELLKNIPQETKKKTCKKCDWLELEDKTSVCKVCGFHCPF